MQNVKRLLKIMNIIILVFFAVLLVFIILVFIFSFLFGNDIKIYEFNADVTLTENGDMEVIETWDIKYSGDYNVRFRDIKYGKYNSGNPLYQEPDNVARFNTMEGYSVKVFDEDNNDVTGRVGYSFNNDVDERGEPLKDPYKPNEEVLFVDMTNKGGLQGRFIFEYRYIIIGAVTQYSDVSELNWRFIDYAEAKIKKATININLPSNDLEKTHLLTWGHGLSKGFITIESNDAVNIEMEDILVSGSENIEIRLLADNSLFTNISSYNQIFEPTKINKNIIIEYEKNLADETNRKIIIANVILYSSILVVILMGFVIFYVYKKHDKEYDPLFKEKYLHDPPSDLSPAQMSYLYYFEKTNDEDVTATLLDLIRRKYLKIILIDEFMTDKEASFKITLDKDKKLTDLLPHEAHLINWFISKIGDGTSVTNKTIEEYGSSYAKAEVFNNDARMFKTLVKQSCSDKDFFETKAKNKGKLYAFVLIPIISLILVNLVSMNYNIDSSISTFMLFIITAVYLIYVTTIKKRSVNGNEEFVKWQAFKNFLVDFGTFKDYPMPGIIIWERFLVYATSFKIADLVMKQLEVKLPDLMDEKNSTYLALSYPRYHLGFMMYNMSRTMTTARTTVQRTVVRHNQSKSGGFGSGGGFSGGSSFGGGGGGGRSR